MCDEAGHTLDDGVIVRLDELTYRVTSSEPWLFWFERFARGLSVSIADKTDALAALALKGRERAPSLTLLWMKTSTTCGFFGHATPDLAPWRSPSPGRVTRETSATNSG